MSKMGLHDPFGHLTYKLWPKEGLGVKLSSGVPHVVEKLSMRATTLHEISFQSNLSTQSYVPLK
jgi:hypothetical protein